MIRRTVVLAVLAATVSSRAEAQSINFDGTSAPCIFASTSPLTNLYAASLGVTFGGGGAILNQCGSFGINARSGTDFWAFNTNTYATGPAKIEFLNPITVFSIWASGGDLFNRFTLRAFNGAAFVGSTSTDVAANSYRELSFSAASITGIEISSNPDQTYVFDDLSFQTSAVPEPGTLALLATGLAGIAARRRKKTAV
jgi:hypothetical protein